MNWITVSLIGYFLIAFSFILDKALLKKRITYPSVYAFYVALMSALSLFLVPFGVHWVDWWFFIISVFSGAIFVWGLLLYYYAVKENEISRVAPLVGTITQITIIGISVFLSGKNFSLGEMAGLSLLVAGGFLISFDLPLRYKKIFLGIKYSLPAGIIIGSAFIFFDYLYDYLGGIGERNVFLNGFFWTRLGLVIGGAGLLLRERYRKNIYNSIFAKDGKNKKQRSPGTIFFFILNKIFGGGSSILINYAISLGSVAGVQALSSIQFVFVLLFASLLMRKYPNVFEEKLYFWDWAQKVGAIGLIAGGFYLISFAK